MGKYIISKINIIYLAGVTAIQVLCAAVIGFFAHEMRWMAFFELLSLFVFVVLLSLLIFRRGRGYFLIALYVFSLPAVFDTGLYGGHWFGAPDAPRGYFEQLNVQRFVWPHISEIGYSYGLNIMEDEEYINLSKSADYLWNDFIPPIEAYYGTYSPTVYKRYVSLAFGSLKKEIASETLYDFNSYFFAPITTEMNLLMGTDSRNGRNFVRVIGASGNLGRFYYHFSFFAAVGLAILAVINVCMNGIKLTNVFVSLGLVLAVSMYDIYCPIRGYDYRNAAWIYITYGLLLCNILRRTVDRELPNVAASDFSYNLEYMRKSNANF